jgi:PPOX class probable F420-dependent enzyme
VSRRNQIVMRDEEVADLLAASRTVTCATIGRDGRPHLMPLWYVVRSGTLWAWTYAKSQKVRNLERDPRCTLQLEAGAGVYTELRGVMIEAEAVIHRDFDVVAGVGAQVASRYAGTQVGPEMVAAQAAKRVALEFVPRRTATWDHRKLGAGIY